MPCAAPAALYSVSHVTVVGEVGLAMVNAVVVPGSRGRGM